MVRVRIAPSPTGIPHIGNTRTALFDYLFAKHNNGKFILRIEDTDQKRIVPGAKEAIQEILNWLGIRVDETYTQSERLEIYKKHAQDLLGKGVAYEKEGAIWVKMPKERVFSWEDAVGQNHIEFKSDVLEDFVALKSDGFPTYHLASVVDDHLMEITHVIRGVEWISSTPKHLYLYESFSWQPPVFAHLPVILGPDKTKLSKRHGAKSVLDYRDEGFLKEALINYMALLGWSPKNDQEIFSIEELIQLFDLKNVNVASPIFDIKKLEWMNGMYIREVLSSEDLIQRLYQFDKELEQIDKKTMQELVEIAKTRIKTLAEFKPQIIPFLRPEKHPVKEEIKSTIDDIKKDLQSITDATWGKQAIADVILQEYILKKKISYKDLYMVLIGADRGLPLADMFAVLGKEKTLTLFSAQGI